MTVADALIAGGILAVAGWLLYRSLWVRRGACVGCSSGGSCRPAARTAPALVSLGRRAASPDPTAPGDRP